MSVGPEAERSPGRTVEAIPVGEERRCGGGGCDAWQPALVHENGSGGRVVKFNSSSAVGAKCGVWQVSHPHSFSCVQVGQVFGGRGRMPTTEAVEVACAEVSQPVIWWQVTQRAE